MTQREELPEENGFQVMFIGDVVGDNKLYDIMKLNRVLDVAQNMELCIVGNGELPVDTEQMCINGKYSFFEKDNFAILKLANNGKGLLSTYKEQWGWMVDKLNST